MQIGEKDAGLPPWTVVIVAALGFLCYRAASWTLFHSGLSGASVDGAAYARLAQVVGVVILVIADMRRWLDSFSWTRVIAGSSVAMTVGALLVTATHFSAEAPSWVILLGCTVHGFFCSAVFIGWGYFFSSLSPRSSVLAITLAFLLYSLCIPILQSLAPEVLGAMATVLPAVCGVVLISLFPLVGYQGVASRSLREALGSVPWWMFGTLLLCSVIGGASEAILPGDILWEDTPLERYWAVASILVFSAAVVWVKILGRNDPQNMWPLFSFVLMCGLLCFASFYFIDRGAASACMRATQEYLTCFIWVCLVSTINAGGLPKVAAFGVGAVVLIHGEHLSAYLCSFAFPLLGIVQSEVATVAAATGMGIALVMATLVATQRRANTLIGEAARAYADGVDALESAVKELADSCGLSPRERDVALCLLRGYTYRAMAEQLCIATDTVRYNVRNVYRKTGVHNRQELITLAETFPQDTAQTKTPAPR